MTQWIFFLPSPPGASKNSKAHLRGSRSESSTRTFSNQSCYRGSGPGWDKGEKAERSEQTKLKGLFYIKKANCRSNTRKARERKKKTLYVRLCCWHSGSMRNWQKTQKLKVVCRRRRGEGEAKRGAGASNQAHRQGGKHTGELHQLIRTLPTRAVGLQRKKKHLSFCVFSPSMPRRSLK